MLDDEKVEQVYRFIAQYCQANEYPPTYTEIANGCAMTLSTARRCLDVLEARGRITRGINAKRTIKLLPKGNTL